MQLRVLFLAVLQRAEDLFINQKGLGDQVPGEGGQGVIPQVCLFARRVRVHKGVSLVYVCTKGVSDSVHTCLQWMDVLKCTVMGVSDVCACEPG